MTLVNLFNYPKSPHESVSYRLQFIHGETVVRTALGGLLSSIW